MVTGLRGHLGMVVHPRSSSQVYYNEVLRDAVAYVWYDDVMGRGDPRVRVNMGG